MDQLYRHTLEKIEALELRNMLQAEEDKLGAVLKINPLVLVALRAKIGHRCWQECTNAIAKSRAKQGNHYQLARWRRRRHKPPIAGEGDLLYGFLKSENGVHRLVRVSGFTMHRANV